MIKIEKTEVFGWKAAIRGMRNAHNSWDKGDSYDMSDFLFESDFEEAKKEGLINKDCVWNPNCPEQGERIVVGKNDLKLMRSLAKAGTDHSKFARMINVTVDITAPLYWVAEHDTYKVATVKNSCSFMHKGVSKPFEINDFSVQDERIYYLLNPIEPKTYELTYPYETDSYRIYELSNGRKYKVFRNGKVVACEFTYTDNYGKGRTRMFSEKETKPSKTKNGYYELNLGGRSGEKWLLHRLVATVWKDNLNNFETVNHIDGNKGNNSIENLEWCKRDDNIKDGFKKGLYDKNKLHLVYNSWKNGHTVVSPETKLKIKYDYANGLTSTELSEKYEVPKKTINNILFNKPCKNEELFRQAYVWEQMIDKLNQLRELYLETKDETIFFEIRQLLPQGYNIKYTWQANYQVLWNIYKARKNHRLPEWKDFCKWIETLPYFKEIYL